MLGVPITKYPPSLRILFISVYTESTFGICSSMVDETTTLIEESGKGIFSALAIRNSNDRK